ncbi:hypothetical protein [Akkermansia sp.]|uniref:hypothetical protein n=1 Tax=Akkermansia sp. TaxID=1872421 RepID=UPI003AB7EFD1
MQAFPKNGTSLYPPSMAALPTHSPVFIRQAAPADFPAWMEMTATVRDDFPGMAPADHRGVMERCTARNTAFGAWTEGELAGGFEKEDSTPHMLKIRSAKIRDKFSFLMLCSSYGF